MALASGEDGIGRYPGLEKTGEYFIFLFCLNSMFNS
jgi:hypothetical protein